MIELPILLNTKFHRPVVPEDFITRPWLFESLNQGLTRPFTLISAPAGYGKTTLVSAWLEELETPNAWISLDGNDNHLDLFFAYFLSAIATLFPYAGKHVQFEIGEASLQNPADLSRCLINELDQVSQNFVVVLDDYSAIQDTGIHNLLSDLLRHPPRGLHLLLTCRHDPPLPVNRLRVAHQLVEIRGPGLRFGRQEISTFIEKGSGVQLNDAALTALEKKTEGWAAGLRLVALSMPPGSDLDPSIVEIQNDNRYVMEYLSNEVLSRLPARIEAFLLKTSILENLNKSLCMAVSGSSEPFENGQSILEWLADANLFTEAVDEQGKWFHYHPLFRQILLSCLRQKYSPAVIADLHLRASKWFSANGYIDEAIDHARLGGDIDTVVHLIVENRHMVMNREGWEQLERWVEAVPCEILDDDPDLILTETWLQRKHSQVQEMAKNLERIEGIMQRKSLPPAAARPLSGEIDALRSQLLFWQADPQEALQFARTALEKTPLDRSSARGVAWSTIAGALQMKGDLNEAFEALGEGLKESKYHHHPDPCQIFVALALIHWMEADPAALIQSGEYLLSLAQEGNLQDSLSWAHYFLGCACYEMNCLEEAEKHFAAVIRQAASLNTLPHIQSLFGLAGTYLAQGEIDRASSLVKSARMLALEWNNSPMLVEIQAFQLRISKARGSKGGALRLASRNHQVIQFPTLPTLFPVPFTLVQSLLDQETAESLHLAAQLIDGIQENARSNHHIRHLIASLAAKALLLDALHQEKEALVCLEEAVDLAQPGGVIRVFVDWGKPLAGLLSRLSTHRDLSDYVNLILQAFQPSKADLKNPSNGKLMEPLTNRELEILILLAQRLSNKEIARELVISPLTVKRHNINIYQKLNANNRREAVLAALSLGLVPKPYSTRMLPQ